MILTIDQSPHVSHVESGFKEISRRNFMEFDIRNSIVQSRRVFKEKEAKALFLLTEEIFMKQGKRALFLGNTNVGIG